MECSFLDIMLTSKNMDLVKTTRLTKQNESYLIEIPHECITKLGWREGHILQIDTKNSEVIIKKLDGFVGV